MITFLTIVNGPDPINTTSRMLTSVPSFSYVEVNTEQNFFEDHLIGYQSHIPGERNDQLLQGAGKVHQSNLFVEKGKYFKFMSYQSTIQAP